MMEVVTRKKLIEVGLPLEKIVDRLRAETEGAVKLTVQHKGETAPVTLAIKPASFAVPVVLGDLRGPDNKWNFLLDGHSDIGYIRLTSFGEHSESELKAALEELAERCHVSRVTVAGTVRR